MLLCGACGRSDRKKESRGGAAEEGASGAETRIGKGGDDSECQCCTTRCVKKKKLKAWELYRCKSERERGREKERTRDRDRNRKREREETGGAGGWEVGGQTTTSFLVGFFVGDCFYQNNIAFFGTEYRFF